MSNKTNVAAQDAADKQAAAKKAAKKAAAKKAAKKVSQRAKVPGGEPADVKSDEELIAEKVKAGLSAEQAREVLERQRKHDAALEKSKGGE